MSNLYFNIDFIKKLTDKKIAIINPIGNIDRATNVDAEIIIFAVDVARNYNTLAHTFYRSSAGNQIPQLLSDTYIIEEDNRSEIGFEVISKTYLDIQIVEQIEQLKLTTPWLYLTPNYNFKHTNSVYHPVWFLSTCLHTIERDIQIDIKSTRPMLVNFMMFRPYWDRLIALNMLAQESWFDRCAYNFPNVTDPLHTNLINQSYNFYLDEQEKQLMSTFDQHQYDTTETITDLYGLGLLTNRAFGDSYFNLFGESGYPHPNVTEKSALPFLAGQFPMIWGAPGLTDHMTSLGFDMFTDLIPDVNNSNLTLRQKVKMFIQCLNNLVDNIDEIWQQTYERRLHNYQLARSSELISKLEKPLKEKLNG